MVLSVNRKPNVDMSKFRVCMHKLSWSDFMGVYGRRPQFLIFAMLLKPFKSKLLEVEDVFEYPDFQMVDQTLPVMDKAVEVIERKGFRNLGVYHKKASGDGLGHVTTLHYMEEAGTIGATCITLKRDEPIDVTTAFITKLKSGKVLLTSNPLTSMPPPGFVDRKLLRGATNEELLSTHLMRIKGKRFEWSDLTDEQVKLSHLEYVESGRNYFIECGVYELLA